MYSKHSNLKPLTGMRSGYFYPKGTMVSILYYFQNILMETHLPFSNLRVKASIYYCKVHSQEKHKSGYFSTLLACAGKFLEHIQPFYRARKLGSEQNS